VTVSLTSPDDWGPFGRPLFDDKTVQALSRVGVVDVGSNSVRMVIFDGAARSPAYFYNEKILCGLGAGLPETGHLNPEGKRRALAALKRFQAIARGLKIKPLTVVATAAMREARDGPEFAREIEQETGLKLWVIDGLEEARLSAQGVLLGWPEADGLVCDIGGSSMELAIVRDGDVGKRMSSALGPLKLQNIPGGRKGLKSHIAGILDELAEEMGTGHKRIYLVGGSWRVIARLDMERRNYPLHVLHEYRMSPKDISQTVKWIGEQDLQDMRHRTGTSAARMALVPAACEVLRQLTRRFKPRDVAVSSYGIREGMLYEQMPDELRRRDPLIEACRFAEHRDARTPGTGTALYQFLKPLFASAPSAETRLFKAACLLHDVSWRAHPDYRAELCFDNATRANLGGLTHPERIFLGLTLMHRYKNKHDDSRFAPLFELLDDGAMRRAETLGKALRFGAMFSATDPDKHASLRWFPKKKKLELVLRKEAVPLFGEVAEARFNALVKSLAVTASVRISRS
jgi:exopolyphosphatase / guanosine-5'-triphosphate,3'-diphosphate pyrophosphatase